LQVVLYFGPGPSGSSPPSGTSVSTGTKPITGHTGVGVSTGTTLPYEGLGSSGMIIGAGGVTFGIGGIPPGVSLGSVGLGTDVSGGPFMISGHGGKMMVRVSVMVFVVTTVTTDGTGRLGVN